MCDRQGAQLTWQVRNEPSTWVLQWQSTEVPLKPCQDDQNSIQLTACDTLPTNCGVNPQLSQSITSRQHQDNDPVIQLSEQRARSNAKLKNTVIAKLISMAAMLGSRGIKMQAFPSAAPRDSDMRQIHAQKLPIPAWQGHGGKQKINITRPEYTTHFLPYMVYQARKREPIYKRHASTALIVLQVFIIIMNS